MGSYFEQRTTIGNIEFDLILSVTAYESGTIGIKTNCDCNDYWEIKAESQYQALQFIRNELLRNNGQAGITWSVEKIKHALSQYNKEEPKEETFI